MKHFGSILKQVVSATLVASLITGTYGSVAFADQTVVRSCRLVNVETYLQQHERHLSAEVKPVLRGVGTRLRAASYKVLTTLKWPGKRKWSEADYLTRYTEVRAALDAGKEVTLTDYQTPEALLAVFDVASERARAESNVFDTADFSFGAMMRNTDDAGRAMLMKRVQAAVDPKGYKDWQAGDAMVNLYMLTKDPLDSLGYLRSRGENKAIRDLIQRRLEAQILRRELGSVLKEIGLGRANQPMKDTLMRGWMRARTMYKSVLWTTVIIGSTHLGVDMASLRSMVLSATSATSMMPIGDITATRKPLSPELEDLAITQKQDMEELWSHIPLRDKAKAAAQINMNVAQYITMRVMFMVMLIMTIDEIWKWQKPAVRKIAPKLVDTISIPSTTQTQAQLEDAVYKKWHDQYVAMIPDIDTTPAAQDTRKEIHAASKALLDDVANKDGSLSQLGIAQDVSVEKAKSDMHAFSVDKSPDGTDNSPYAGLPPISE